MPRILYVIFVIRVLSTCTATLHHDYSTADFHDNGYEKWLQPYHLSLNQSHLFEYDNVSSISPYNGFPLVKNPQERLLPVFTWVRLHNSGCKRGGESGTCITARECQAKGGKAIGSCAKGFGTCCYTQISCGGSSSTNCTHLVSPNYPGTYNAAQLCSMTFRRIEGICQLRLDFVEFDSVQPDGLGVCNEDRFTVEGERKFTYLCGRSPEKWHFYLDVNGKPNPTVFNFLTSGANFERRFKIKVSMIQCRQKVPCGCGQYFTGDTGTIQSFNYGQGPYLAGVDYAICTRKEKNRCTTTLTREGPSFVSCNVDLYKLPVGQVGANTGTLALDVRALYCQVNANPNLVFLAMVTTIPSPLTSVTNGPFSIWHYTVIDNVPNYLSNANCLTCAGFHQTFQHNPC